jgi:hypothetical protein
MRIVGSRGSFCDSLSFSYFPTFPTFLTMSLRTQNHDDNRNIPDMFIILFIIVMLCTMIIVVKWSIELMKLAHTATPTYATQSQQDCVESINIRIQFTPIHQATVRHRTISSLDLGPSLATIAVTKSPRYMKKDI